jgi:hypothetical protein
MLLKKYRPNSELHIYNGTLCVNRSVGNATTISGHYYQFLNPIYGPPSTFSDLPENVTVPHIALQIPIPHIPFGILVYPRNRYYAYLKVLGIRINNRLGKCNLVLTVEPPVGSFDGTFAEHAFKASINY